MIAVSICLFFQFAKIWPRIGMRKIEIFFTELNSIMQSTARPGLKQFLVELESVKEWSKIFNMGEIGM